MDRKMKVRTEKARYTKFFNKLPRDVRHIAAMNETSMRINQLEMEKSRLKKHYRQSVREINDHIKNLEDWLIKEGKQ